LWLSGVKVADQAASFIERPFGPLHLLPAQTSALVLHLVDRASDDAPNLDSEDRLLMPHGWVALSTEARDS
jgi:hypothetical protein